MNLRRITMLPLVATLLFLPSFTARAQSGIIASETPAVVVLPNKIDAKKLSTGATVQTSLTHNVKLANGTELPKGSSLIATVSSDDMQLPGHDKLALQFTQARLKNGQTVPIKATIILVRTNPTPVANDAFDIEVNLPVPDSLKDQLDQIQEDGVVSGVNLRARANSSNSGVFVTDKDDIKLPNGSKMLLAVAPGK